MKIVPALEFFIISRPTATPWGLFCESKYFFRDIFALGVTQKWKFLTTGNFFNIFGSATLPGDLPRERTTFWENWRSVIKNFFRLRTFYYYWTYHVLGGSSKGWITLCESFSNFLVNFRWESRSNWKFFPILISEHFSRSCPKEPFWRVENFQGWFLDFS